MQCVDAVASGINYHTSPNNPALIVLLRGAAFDATRTVQVRTNAMQSPAVINIRSHGVGWTRTHKRPARASHKGRSGCHDMCRSCSVTGCWASTQPGPTVRPSSCGQSYETYRTHSALAGNIIYGMIREVCFVYISNDVIRRCCRRQSPHT